MGARDFQLTAPGPLRLYSTTELLTLPPPTWLVDKIIPAGGLVALYGPPGCGKSFVALDIALSVASGRPWQGFPVEAGYVLYIAAEGGTGIGKRAKAWLLHNKVRPSQADVAWLVESLSVHVDSDQMATLLERVTSELEFKPSLVIVDTLARCFDGDENEQQDMGRFIAGVDHLRSQFNCTVLVIHHTRLAGDRERGNTAFRGACDAMLSVEKDDQNITVACSKQKDAEEFEDIGLSLTTVEDTDSCVVTRAGVNAQAEEQLSHMLETLAGLQPCTWDTWVDALKIPRGRVFTHIQTLKKQELVTKVDGLWKVKG